jgi:hypothetical protein
MFVNWIYAIAHTHTHIWLRKESATWVLGSNFEQIVISSCYLFNYLFRTIHLKWWKLPTAKGNRKLHHENCIAESESWLLYHVGCWRGGCVWVGGVGVQTTLSRRRDSNRMRRVRTFAFIVDVLDECNFLGFDVVDLWWFYVDSQWQVWLVSKGHLVRWLQTASLVVPKTSFSVNELSTNQRNIKRLNFSGHTEFNRGTIDRLNLVKLEQNTVDLGRLSENIKETLS